MSPSIPLCSVTTVSIGIIISIAGKTVTTNCHYIPVLTLMLRIANCTIIFIAITSTAGIRGACMVRCLFIENVIVIL